MVQGVPRRAPLHAASASRVMDAKSVQHRVPQWLIAVDEERFAQRNPDVVYDQVPAAEVLYVEILGLLDALGVLFQAPVELVSCVGGPTAGARPFGDGFPYIDRPQELALRVGRGDCPVRWEAPRVVDGVNAGAEESFCRRQRMDVTKQQRPRDTVREVQLVERVERLRCQLATTFGRTPA